MNVPLSRHWQDFVAEAVRSGRFGSAEAVVEEGLRLIETREAQAAALRAEIAAALADPREVSEEELDASLQLALEQLRAEGCE